jgi:SNF2 family DNA or RNA helicase
MRFLGYTGLTTRKAWETQGLRQYREDGLARVMLVMDYSDTDIVLPEKEEVAVTIKFSSLSEEEQFAYVEIRRLVQEAFIESIDHQRSFVHVLALFTALRQTCIAPYLLTTISKRSKAFKDPTLKTRLQRLVESGSLKEWLHDETGTAGYHSAKINACIDIVKKIPSNEKVLIFSNFTSCLDLVAKGLEEAMPGYEYAHFDGDTTSDQRADIIHRFKGDPNLKCLLLTYRAGAEGLDLTSATRCIRVDMWWNDAVPRQAAARAWRIGQTRKVTIYNIILDATIETYMLQVCDLKRITIDAFMQQGVTAPKRLTREEIGKMIGITDYTRYHGRGKRTGDDEDEM